jgi:hypothetical protein
MSFPVPVIMHHASCIIHHVWTIRLLIGVLINLPPSIMSSWTEDDTALASAITKLPVELKRVILELTVYNNRKLALELVAKSSLFKQWSVRLGSLLCAHHILVLLQA